MAHYAGYLGSVISKSKPKPRYNPPYKQKRKRTKIDNAILSRSFFFVAAVVFVTFGNFKKIHVVKLVPVFYGHYTIKSAP